MKQNPLKIKSRTLFVYKSVLNPKAKMARETDLTTMTATMTSSTIFNK